MSYTSPNHHTPNVDLSHHRLDYGDEGFGIDDLHPNPVVQLQQWVRDASETNQLVEPTAMIVASVDHEGNPTMRTVLLRRIVAGKLLFFTNFNSRKAQHFDRDDAPAVSCLFRWANPQRQVEVRGTVKRGDDTYADNYFASRPRGSQIGAHASAQSQVIESREELDRLVEQTNARFEDCETIPRPADWGCYAVTPFEVEFWMGRRSRLHDRARYTLRGTQWMIERLAP